jgi:hypothetical protein
MRKLTVSLVLLALATLAPAGTAVAVPAGPETNPVGSLRWLPSFTNAKPAAGLNRLVVVYDRSLNSAGKPAALFAKGPFALRIGSTSPGLRMKGHSPGVGSIDEAGPLGEAVIAVHGDVRDGDCAEAGSPAFSAAYSSTRSFLHNGSTPYEPESGPGACEVVDSSTRSGSGFQTRVTTYVPGFWVDVQWSSSAPTPQVWYEALYDSQGENGPFYTTSDSAGASTSIQGPPPS